MSSPFNVLITTKTLTDTLTDVPVVGPNPNNFTAQAKTTAIPTFFDLVVTSPDPVNFLACFVDVPGPGSGGCSLETATPTTLSFGVFGLTNTGVQMVPPVFKVNVLVFMAAP